MRLSNAKGPGDTFRQILTHPSSPSHVSFWPAQLPPLPCQLTPPRQSVSFSHCLLGTGPGKIALSSGSCKCWRTDYGRALHLCGSTWTPCTPPNTRVLKVVGTPDSFDAAGSSLGSCLYLRDAERVTAISTEQDKDILHLHPSMQSTSLLAVRGRGQRDSTPGS